MDSNLLFQVLEKTIQKIQCADSKEILQVTCANFFKKAQVDYFMFTLFHSSSLIDPEILILDNLPAAWCDFYHRRGLVRIDPITSYCFSNIVPIYWHKLVQLPEYSDPQFLAMMHNAKSFGLASGLSIPLRTVTGGFGILSLISRQTAENSEKSFKILTPYAMLLTTHLLESINRNNWLNKEQSPDKIKLTGREYDCLFWACEGKTSWEISKILCISERTVMFHLNHATEKVGAKNRQHAVAKGILGNIIKPKFYPDYTP